MQEIKVIIQKVFNVGVHIAQNEYLKDKVVLSNYFALFILHLSIIFIFLSYFFIPQIISIFIFAFIVLILCVFINSIHKHMLSRLILSIQLSVASTIFVLSLTQGGHQHPVGGAVLHSFIALPFFLFDIREVLKLLASLFLCVFLLLIIPTLLDDIFVVNVNTDFFSFINYTSNAFVNAVIIIFACSIVLLRANLIKKTQIKHLTKDTEQARVSLINQKKELELSLLKLKASQKERELQTWLINGINQMSHLIQQNSTSDNLCFLIVKAMSEYLDISNAGFFIIESDDRIVLKSEFVLNNKNKLKNISFLFEGDLDGEVIKSGQTIFVPLCSNERFYKKDNFLIQKSLFIVPLITNNEVIGVFEFHFQEDSTPVQVNFAENASENIAIMIHNLHYLKV